MDRRSLLKYVSLSTAGAAFSFTFPSLRAAVAGESAPGEWHYEGKEGPELWGELSPDYKVCSAGEQQSPVNLVGAIPAKLRDFTINYHLSALRIVNNGHTVMLHTDPGNYILLEDERFDLIQFHFHHPSEHAVTGERFPMEAHFVHRNAKGELAVLGVFVKEGKENLHLQPIWKDMPREKSTEHVIPGGHVNVSQLYPLSHKAFRYMGSLTTPPCNQLVRWIVFEETIEASKEQLDLFAQIFPMNARPLQPLNNRYILES